MLRQPFLKKYYNNSLYKNSDFIDNNAFYIGNNQFVDSERMELLKRLIKENL